MNHPSGLASVTLNRTLMLVQIVITSLQAPRPRSCTTSPFLEPLNAAEQKHRMALRFRLGRVWEQTEASGEGHQTAKHQ